MFTDRQKALAFLELNEGGSDSSVNVSSVSPTQATKDQSVTFELIGSNLPSTIAMSLQDGECGSPYNVSITRAYIDCTPRATGNKLFYVALQEGDPVPISGSPLDIVVN